MDSDGTREDADVYSEEDLFLEEEDNDREAEDTNDGESDRDSDSGSDIEEGLAFTDEKDVVEPIAAGKEYLPGYSQVWRYSTFPQTWTWRKRKFWILTAEHHPQHLIQQHYEEFARDFNARYYLRYRSFSAIDTEARMNMLEDVSRHRIPS